MANKLAERLLNKTSGVAKAVADNPGKPIADQAPVTMPGQLGAFRLEAQKYQDRIKKLEADLLEAQTNGASAELPLEQLFEVAGRRRKLTAQQYNELKQNLRNNPLVTPITVRVRPEGGYEVISGSNRVAIFRELGRAQIPARVLDSDDTQAEINAFFANLLQADLPDYEKYLGFKKIMEVQGNLTHAEIAERAGVSRSFVSQLMAFDDLPEAALAILAESPATIGANAAQDLAALAKKGRAQQVVEAVTKVAAGELDQGKAVKFAAVDVVQKVVTTKPQPVRIKLGKATFCSLQRADKVLRIQFESAAQAEAVQEAIRIVLEQRAKELHASSHENVQQRPESAE
jgi:ParB family transcriptional regulator, chromosome partitioning protein